MLRTESGKYQKRTNCRHLLGKTAAELKRELGEPFASYNYGDGEIFLYESTMVESIAFRNGVATKCNDLSDSRRAARVKPTQPIPVIITGEENKKGLIKDISVAGAAVLHSENFDIKVNTRAILTFLLPVNGCNRCLEIACKAMDTRIINGRHVTVFLFDLTSDCRTKRAISNYVSLRRAQNVLGLDDAMLFELPAITSNLNRIYN
jgi:hypothetical protein